MSTSLSGLLPTGMSAGAWANLGNTAVAIFDLLPVVAVPLGLGLIVWALMTAAKVGRGGSGIGYGAVTAAMMSGALLMTLGTDMLVVTHTLFGNNLADAGSAGEMSYVAPQAVGGQNLGVVIQKTLTQWIVMMGWIAMIRGVYVWHAIGSGHSAQQGSPFWRGFILIVGGVLAANIAATLALLAYSFL